MLLVSLITSQEMSQMNPLGITGWSFIDFYQTVGVLGVPLFLMLTGALLLQPEKKESLNVFFKKRWSANRFAVFVLGRRVFCLGFSSPKIYLFLSSPSFKAY